MESTAVTLDVVSEAWKFQYASYLNISASVLMVYDWLTLFDHEIKYVWPTKWNVGKILYVISRYGPFVDMSIRVITETPLLGGINPDTCTVLFKISSWSLAVGICISEAVFLLRTNAIYSGSKRIVIPLSIFFLISVAAVIVINWRRLQVLVFGPSFGSLFMRCNIVRTSRMGLYAFLVLFVFELAVVILTVKRGFRDFRSGTTLLRVVYRDSIFFFFVLSVLSFSVIFVVALGPPQYGGVMVSFARVIHSVVCCRMLLNLKRATSPPTMASVDTPVDGLAFAAPPRLQLSKSIMVLSEAPNVEGGEEDNRNSATRNESIEEVE